MKTPRTISICPSHWTLWTRHVKVGPFRIWIWLLGQYKLFGPIFLAALLIEKAPSVFLSLKDFLVIRRKTCGISKEYYISSKKPNCCMNNVGFDIICQNILKHKNWIIKLSAQNKNGIPFFFSCDICFIGQPLLLIKRFQNYSWTKGNTWSSGEQKQLFLLL